MTKAYELLSPAMQEFLCTLTVTHDNEGFIRRMIEKTGDPDHELVHKLREHYPPVVHPLIRTHPETGKRALLWFDLEALRGEMSGGKMHVSGGACVGAVA